MFEAGCPSNCNPGGEDSVHKLDLDPVPLCGIREMVSVSRLYHWKWNRARRKKINFVAEHFGLCQKYVDKFRHVYTGTLKSEKLMSHINIINH